jgi:hypothetical protein
MKLPTINKKILDEPFVHCCWNDINSSAIWTSFLEAKASKVTICITAGWLLRADKDVHVIAGDVNFNDDGTLGDVGNVTTMPSVNVLKIKKVSV